MAVVPPLALPGPYAVACSDVAQDFSRVPAGEDVQAYWEGVARPDGRPRYVTDLWSEPASTLSVSVNAPGDPAVFGRFAGRSVAFAVLVCYPTSAANPRGNYALPTGRVVPHMQRAGDAPLWPEGNARFPLLLFSHGYDGSPLSNDYVGAITVLASFGYVVAAPFHGDGRFSDLKIDDLADLARLLLNLPDYLALQALRPLSISKTIDRLLDDPQWGARIDAARIGGFGASMGGETMLLVGGAGLTTSFGFAWTQIVNDPRLKAAVGYIPYFGQPFLPAFGRGQHGLDGVTLPYLAIGGTADTTAPLVSIYEGMVRLGGPRELVSLIGVPHRFDVASTADIFTWTLTFLDAELRGDPIALAKLAQMASVAGGGDDHVVIPLDVPSTVNYGGLWWNAPAESESGWGINVAHQGEAIFATWLTYDFAHRPWWLSMTALQSGPNTFTGTLFQTSGPPFNSDAFDPKTVRPLPVGSGTLTFGDANNGIFAYDVQGVKQQKSITRQVFGPIPTCTFGALPDAAAATNYQDLWWNPAESGWGINITQQGDVIFAVWFTYDTDRAPLWLSVTARPGGGGSYAGLLYRTTGPAFDAVPFDPALVKPDPVGNARFDFADGNHATFTYTVGGITRSKSITRQVFRAPGTVCR